MTIGRRVSILAQALLAALFVLAASVPARADNSCSLQDLGNAAQNTYNGFVNGQCGSALADPVAAALTLYLTTLVGGMGSQSAGFCQAVSDVSNWTTNAQQNINNAKSALDKVDPSGQLASKLDSAINSVNGALPTPRVSKARSPVPAPSPPASDSCSATSALRRGRTVRLCQCGSQHHPGRPGLRRTADDLSGELHAKPLQRFGTLVQLQWRRRAVADGLRQRPLHDRQWFGAMPAGRQRRNLRDRGRRQ